jgi:hypothetical protein
MFKKALFFGLAVAFGATIGAFLTYLVSEQFWWIGLCTGGFLSYLLVDIKQLPKAWKVAIAHLKIPAPRKDERKSRILLGISSGLAFITFFPGVLLFFHLLPNQTSLGHLSLNISCIVLTVVLFLAWFLPALYVKNIRKHYFPITGSMLEHDKPIKWCHGFLANGLVILCIIFVGCLYGVFVKLLYEQLLPATWIFFRYIHSKKRVLALVDGSLAMFLAHKVAGSGIEMMAVAFIGGLIISIFHFYIVSVKILKLVPNGSEA